MNRFGKALLVSAASVWGFAAETPPVIVNSGSTNSPGFRIVVERSGDAKYTPTRRAESPEPVQRRVPAALVRRFYADLEAAKPLSALPAEHCAKSASFGTKLTVESGGDVTPDLSCPSPHDPRIRTLARDTNEIVKVFRTK